jgi:cytidylate kinase
VSGAARVIAIDGPAASGKGTLARRLAEHFGLRHLDTGLTYRAVADRMLAEHADLGDEDAAVAAADALDFSHLDRARLSQHAIGEAASRVAIMPRLRRALRDKQRAFAAAPPGAVLDGRDIGTVVLPDASAKLFVTASPEVRARRRALEMNEAGNHISEADVLEDLKRRDARDMEREDSPLRPAPDAYLLDTTDKDIEAAFRAAVSYVSRATTGLREGAP